MGYINYNWYAQEKRQRALKLAVKQIQDNKITDYSKAPCLRDNNGVIDRSASCKACPLSAQCCKCDGSYDCPTFTKFEEERYQ